MPASHGSKNSVSASRGLQNLRTRTLQWLGNLRHGEREKSTDLCVGDTVDKKRERSTDLEELSGDSTRLFRLRPRHVEERNPPMLVPHVRKRTPACPGKRRHTPAASAISDCKGCRSEALEEVRA
eukprot:1460426-Rhodomonas_salina.3